MTSLLGRLRRALPAVESYAAPEGGAAAVPPLAVIRAGERGPELFASDGRVAVVVPLQGAPHLLMLIEQACAGVRHLKS